MNTSTQQSSPPESNLRNFMEKRFDEILSVIINYLQRLSINQNSELEREYYAFIEQDAEKLLELNNYAILNIDIFEKVKFVFKMLIAFSEEEQKTGKFKSTRHIIRDIYFIFKYVYENILFMIENEFLEN